MTGGLSETVLVIMGMRDNACRERLAEALAVLPGVEDVDVNLLHARAAIVHRAPCGLDALLGAVVRAGFGAALAPTSPPTAPASPPAHRLRRPPLHAPDTDASGGMRHAAARGPHRPRIPRDR